MKKKDLEQLGRHYREAAQSRMAVYQLAEKLFNKPLERHAANIAQLESVVAANDFEVGLMLAVDWGAELPKELSKHVKLVPVATGIH